MKQYGRKPKPIISAVLTEDDWNDFLAWHGRQQNKPADQISAMGMYVQQRRFFGGRYMTNNKQPRMAQ